MLKSEKFIQSTHRHYPLEIDQDFPAECTKTAINNLTTDNRYSRVDFETNEYLIQEQSGVLATLEALPYYEDYQLEINQRNTKLYLFTRPTTPWKLDCEFTHPKVQLMEALKSVIEEEKILIETGTQKIQAIFSITGCMLLSGSTYSQVSMMLSGKAESEW